MVMPMPEGWINETTGGASAVDRSVMRRVVCAALKSIGGQLVLGPRHFDETMHLQMAQLVGYMTPWEQGFIDQHGTFLTREEAWKVASEAGQIVRRVGGDEAPLIA